MNGFKARIYKIGVNPYVLPPVRVLKELFKQAGKEAGPIPVSGTLNGHAFVQTLVKYSGRWRLYLNGPMRKAAGIDVGDMAEVTIAYDAVERIVAMHPKLQKALDENVEAKQKFEQLAPSLQKEFIRYIANLKSEASVDKNIPRAIGLLLGKERFIGRDKV
jgi:hypothetical protein